MQPNELSHGRSCQLPFRGSPDVTLGVEVELQILDQDPDGGDLAPGALRILDACHEDGLAGVDGEFLLCMAEVKTDICANVHEVKQTLVPLLKRVKNIARAAGYDLALGGTHPFGQAARNAISPGERYQRIRKRQGWLAYHEATFGLHVHVGVPGPEQAIGLMNLLVPHLPHLLALSANSPFWQGVDTEFASARSMIFHPGPHAGIPLVSHSWEEFCHYYQVMHESGIYESPKDLYWDLRPRPDYGTLEFRICDVPASLSLVLALTAFIRYLVINRLELLQKDPQAGCCGLEASWLAAENKSLAARYGLRAECVQFPGGPRQTLAEQVAQTVQEILPAARSAGEEHFLAPLVNPAALETGAERVRRLYRQTGRWRDVIEDMKTLWIDELAEEDGMFPLRLDMRSALPV